MELGKNYLLVTKVWSLLSEPAGGGYSWEFQVGVCRPLLQILTLFQTKKCHFQHPFSDQTSKIHTRFQTLPLGRNYVIITQIRAQTKISSNAFRIHIFLFSRSCSFGIEKTSMFIHSRSFLENFYPIPDQNGKVYTCIQTMYSVAREKQPSYVLI